MSARSWMWTIPRETGWPSRGQPPVWSSTSPGIRRRTHPEETSEHFYSSPVSAPASRGRDPRSQASSTRAPVPAQPRMREPTRMRSGSCRRPEGRASMASVARTETDAGSDSWALSSTTRATPKGSPRAKSPSARKALSISTARAPVCRHSIDLSSESPTTWSTEIRGPRATGSPIPRRLSSRLSARGTGMDVSELVNSESATTTVPGSRSGASAPAKPPSRAASTGTLARAATQRHAASCPTPVCRRTRVGPPRVGRDAGEPSTTVHPGTRTRATSRGMA